MSLCFLCEEYFEGLFENFRVEDKTQDERIKSGRYIKGINMGLFTKKKITEPAIEYNPEKQRAVIKCSICNGEQVAGFKDKQTGHFTEVMLIKDGKDLDIFMKMYDLSSVTKEY